jgi:hypothetical protein
LASLFLNYLAADRQMNFFNFLLFFRCPSVISRSLSSRYSSSLSYKSNYLTGCNVFQQNIRLFSHDITIKRNDETKSLVSCTADPLSSSYVDCKKSKPIPLPLVPIVLEEKDIEERFVKGGGKGGQKINKTSNRVVLVHRPTGIQISCQEYRDLSVNRRVARQLLVEKLDVLLNGKRSKKALKEEKIRKRKQNAHRLIVDCLVLCCLSLLTFFVI